MSVDTTIEPSPEFASVTAPCLYCGSTDYQPLYAGIEDRLGHVPGKWAFLKCQSCGSATLSPTPKEEDLASFYPDVYTFIPDRKELRGLRALTAPLENWLFYQRMHRKQFRLVLNNTNPERRTGLHMLDLGCGTGRRLLEFSRFGYQVHGVDFDAGAVNYVREDLGISATCGSVSKVRSDFGDESFDMLTAFYVIEHVTDVTSIVADCFSLLKPGGWLVAGVPLSDSFAAAVFGNHWSQATEAPRHISLPTQRGMKRSLTNAGFDPRTIKVVTDIPSSCAAQAALTLVPAANTTNMYGNKSAMSLVYRGLGVALTLAFLPMSLFDGYVLRRPATGLVFAQKPPATNGS